MSTYMGILLGHVMDGQMVNLIANNAKLFKRSEKIVMNITGCNTKMAVQKSRKTRSRRDMRRSKIKANAPAISSDPNTGEDHLRHNISPQGFYRGKQVVSIKEKVTELEEQE